MKILLIRPPEKYVKGASRLAAGIPLGLLYIAAVLEKNNYTVEIYDAKVNTKEPTFPVSADSIQMGDSWDRVASKIKNSQPDVVAISCPFSAQLDQTIYTAELVKKIDQNIVTVIGGTHPSVRADDFFLRTKAVDVICQGEGEYSMLDVLNDLKAGENIKGKIFRAEHIQNLDELPYPAYHLINLEDYFLLNKKGFSGRHIWHAPRAERAIDIITSRGCPYNCIFCSIHLHMGKKWRYHSAEYVLGHLELLATKYNIRHVHFEDDNLTHNLERFKEIIAGLIHRQINITWDTPNGIRADNVTKEILRDCQQSGCLYLVFGVESGNQEVSNSIVGKGLKLDRMIQSVKWCKELSLDTMAFYLIGFPGETKENMQETIDLALWLQKKYDLLPSLSIATPLPGTKLEEICVDKGLMQTELSSENLAKMTQGCYFMDSDKFKAEEIDALLERFYRKYKINYVRNSLLFFLAHPRAFFGLLKRLFGVYGFRFGKTDILNILDYKKCLLRDLA
ncbi:B12-binding domain-containing radical SAM protein [Candidatus Margulisiibacteriota bacterium]